MLLDGGGELAQVLPFGQAMHLPVALLAQVPESFVVHFRVTGRIDEALRSLIVVDGFAMIELRAAGLRLRRGRLKRPGCCFAMAQTLAAATARAAIVGRVQIFVKQGRQAILCAAWFLRSAHAASPFRIWAMWRNWSGSPSRSAHPCWCSMQLLSAETT
ncbi:hypothetical protein GCM10009081_26490 [Brevundimonas nasdae]